MRITIALVLLLIAFTLFGCSKQTVESIKPNTQIIIDGIGNDWEKYNLIFNEDLNFVFGALNTDSTLFLMFRFNDPSLARKFSTNGLTLWLDEEKEMGIHYQDIKLTDRLLNANPKQIRKRPIREAFFPEGAFSITQNDKSLETENLSEFGIEAQFEYVNGLYCFEFSVPIGASADEIHLAGKEIIPIGIELAEVSDEVKKALEEKRGQGKSGGGMSGGGKGGGMRGGGRGGRGGGKGGGGGKSSRTDQPIMDLAGKEIWFEIKLAKN
jgi:uncharacterized membrane protein YgcG